LDIGSPLALARVAKGGLPPTGALFIDWLSLVKSITYETAHTDHAGQCLMNQ